jgi:hypothetical protein
MKYQTKNMGSTPIGAHGRESSICAKERHGFAYQTPSKPASQNDEILHLQGWSERICPGKGRDGELGESGLIY